MSLAIPGKFHPEPRITMDFDDAEFVGKNISSGVVSVCYIEVGFLRASIPIGIYGVICTSILMIKSGIVDHHAKD